MRVNKYRNIKVEFNGMKFDSKKELNWFHQLELMKKAKGKDQVINITRGVRMPFLLNGKKMFDYLPDFVVEYADGREEVHDVKGGKATITPVFKLKQKIIEEFYGIKIRVV